MGGESMSQSRQNPRNGLAKILSDADPDTSLEEIAAEKQRFECPECGWDADLQRNGCMVCEYGQPLEPANKSGGGEA
jgi:hypothetical protein